MSTSTMPTPGHLKGMAHCTILTKEFKDSRVAKWFIRYRRLTTEFFVFAKIVISHKL